jgi:uncharacterized protein
MATDNTGQDSTWQKNAPSQIVLNSIFAALAALWISVVLLEHPHILIKAVEVTFALFSFFLFAIAAEGTVRAYDEMDVIKYVYYLLWYNVGVILLGNAIGLVILVHFYQHFFQPPTSFPQWLLLLLSAIVYLSAASLLLWRWIHDAGWLLFISNAEFYTYCDELCAIRTPVLDRHPCTFMSLIFKRRFGYRKPLPHDGVYTRLRPSRIHGLGVFAIRDIPKGTYIFSDDESIVWVDKKNVETLPKALKDVYEDFAVIKGDKYGCPESFDKLTTSWYLNHSDQPNVAADDDYKFYALRDIKTGEELTVDYRTYSERPKGAV